MRSSSSVSGTLGFLVLLFIIWATQSRQDQQMQELSNRIDAIANPAADERLNSEEPTE